MKKSLFLFLAVLLFNSASAQFYVKGGALVNQINKDLKTIYKAKPSYMLGIGQEIGFSLLALDIGLNYYEIKQELNISKQISNNRLAGLSAQLRFKPSSFFDVGAGIMPSVSVSRDEDIFEKSVDVSGLISIGVYPIKNIGVELGYNAGFIPYSTIEIKDSVGATIDQIDSNRNFYHLALKVRL